VMWIDTTGWQPSADWLRRAGLVTQQLIDAAPADRAAIIDDPANQALWKELREELLAMSYDKCWFSEARSCFDYLHVEHFRPKKSAKNKEGSMRDGYWWLAFDFRNYRLCGGVGNTSKGVWFPLRPGTLAAGFQGPIDFPDEAPLLLDPIKLFDVSLLTFANAGVALPSPAASPWDAERADESIKRYKLNSFPPLARARETLWNRFTDLVREADLLMVQQQRLHSADRARRLEDIFDEFNRSRQRNAEFSAMAAAFFKRHPTAWVRELAA
jgi:hypothetical protein